jgi:PKD domain
MTIARFARGGNGRIRVRHAVLLAAALLLLAAAPARGAADWLDPADLSKPGRDAFNPAVAMDSAGNTIAIWERQSTIDASINLQISTRSPGSNFSAPADFSLRSTEPDIAMTPGGEAVAVWKHFENPPGNYVIQAVIRPPGGSFSAPMTVYTAPASVIPAELDVAIAEGGNVAVSWSNVDPDSGFGELICVEEPPLKSYCSNPSYVQASVRTGGGVFSPAKRISPPRFVHPPPPGVETPKEKEEREEKEEEIDKEESKKSTSSARIAIDPSGNAVAIWAYFDGKDRIIQYAVRPSGEDSFEPPQQLSASGQHAGEPVIGMDAAGNAIAAWHRNEVGGRVIQAGLRPPGGPFTVLGNISDAGALADSPAIAVTSGGIATVAWRLTTISDTFIQVATRPPGGSFAKAVSVSNGQDNPLFPEIATNEQGGTVVAWSGDNGPNEITRASVRLAGLNFGPPVAISQSSSELFHPRLAMDLAGDATAVWSRNNGVHDIIQMAGYDAGAPSLHDVSIPATGKVGQPVSFSASSADTWPIGPPRFTFGDGTQADGNSVSHTYTKPGSFVIRVTATDGVGTPTTTTGTILIKARNEFKIGKLSRVRRKGIAKLAVEILEPGSVTATGKGIKKATARSAKGGTVKLTLKAAGKGLKTLNKTGKLKTKLKVSYSPDGGDTNTASHRVKLLKTLE